jgi:hypothetical protein
MLLVTATTWKTRRCGKVQHFQRLISFTPSREAVGGSNCAKNRSHSEENTSTKILGNINWVRDSCKVLTPGTNTWWWWYLVLFDGCQSFPISYLIEQNFQNLKQSFKIQPHHMQNASEKSVILEAIASPLIQQKLK